VPTVLGIDTATARLSVAVRSDDGREHERNVGPDETGRPRHATGLMPAVEEVVGAAGGWQAIDLVAVGIGPGTFTGLRIGVATARALAQARGLGICGISSLAALAAGIAESPRARAGAPVLPVIDARRGEVFAALYSADGEELWPPLVAAPQELARRLSELDVQPLAAGDGSLRFRQALEAGGAIVLDQADQAHEVSARHVCRLAAGAEPGPPEDVKPLYLRRPDAELWRERDRGRNQGG
jgi:tRNA threonylcarbamoyladenosine biosynthesis protein TsaB